MASVTSRYDIRGSLVALLAAAAAAVAAIYGWALVAQFEIQAVAYVFAVAFMCLTAILALILAIARATRRWTTPLRAASIGLAPLFVLASLPLWVMVIVVPGCACPDAPLPVLGDLHMRQTILAAGLAATPILLLVVGLLPQRRGRVRMPAEPGASNGATPAQPGSSD